MKGVRGKLFSKKVFPGNFSQNKKIPRPYMGRKDSVVPPKLPQKFRGRFPCGKGHDPAPFGKWILRPPLPDSILPALCKRLLTKIVFVTTVLIITT